ncbi:hypothetical protein [Actinomadura harenae]|nr:hypothetical protein [Actinomadura harenae]
MGDRIGPPQWPQLARRRQVWRRRLRDEVTTGELKQSFRLDAKARRR